MSAVAVSYSRSYFGHRETISEDRAPERLRKVAKDSAECMRPGSTLTLYAAQLADGIGCGSVQRECYCNPIWIAEIAVPEVIS